MAMSLLGTASPAAVRLREASELLYNPGKPAKICTQYTNNSVIFFILNKKLAGVTILVALHTKHNIFEVISSHFYKTVVMYSTGYSQQLY